MNAPLHQEFAKVVTARLRKRPAREGLVDPEAVLKPVDSEEARIFGLQTGLDLPKSLKRRVERCMEDTVAALVERGLITSGEILAKVLPQVTSGLRALGIADPSLRRLYALIYRAFRRRRSLLLLHLQKQVQIEELPWVAAIDRFRDDKLSTCELASEALEEVVMLTITSFPHAILPNKLLQELKALAQTAELDLPIVEEVATDIFMGVFSVKFSESAKISVEFLRGTIYATYYDIDCDAVGRLPVTRKKPGRKQLSASVAEGFVEMCARRAGVAIGTWDPATNGMIVEQQQILTTHNLAVLVTKLGLADSMSVRLETMARFCFEWICKRQQLKNDDWHGRLIVIKNSAYAWRQMIFYLALMPNPKVLEFLNWASEHLDAQSPEFASRFRPALTGLNLAAEGRKIEDQAPAGSSARRFLGWSKERHWLMP